MRRFAAVLAGVLVFALAGVPAFSHTVQCQGDTLSHSEHGTDGNNSPNLTANADQYHGLDGDDTIDGEGGADTLCGGVGNDSITGSGGGDDINAGDSADPTVNGNDGSDNLHGGDNADNLHGGADPDEVAADAGKDDSYGQGGNDAILPGVPGQDGQPDLVAGGNGTDTMFFCVDTSGTAQDSIVQEPAGDLMENRVGFTQASNPNWWDEFCGLSND